MQWSIRDWMKAVVLLAVAASCLRMGGQVQSGSDEMRQARIEFVSATWDVVDRRERQLEFQVRLLRKANDELTDLVDVQHQLLVIHAEEIAKLKAAQVTAEKGAAADGRCIAPSP